MGLSGGGVFTSIDDMAFARSFSTQAFILALLTLSYQPSAIRIIPTSSGLLGDRLPIRNSTHQTCPELRRRAASHFNPQFQSMCMVRSPKSIGRAVGVTLGNAPYSCHTVNGFHNRRRRVRLPSSTTASQLR